MINQQHTIKKFSLQLQTQSTAQSYALQQNCVKLINENLIAGLDEILSTQFNSNDVVKINKIEIDLGTISTQNLEKDFIAKCIEGFANKIKSIPAKQKLPVDDEISIVDSEENILQQFFNFLSTGKMHWAVYQTGFVQWQVAVIEAIKLKPHLFKKAFRDLLIVNKQVIERLVAQFDEGFIETLVELYQPAIKKEYTYLIQLLYKKSVSADNGIIGKKYLIALLPLLFNSKKKIDENVVIELIERVTNQTQTAIDEKAMVQIKNAILEIAQKLDNNFIAPSLNKIVKEKIENIIEITEIKKEDNKKLKINEAEDKSIYITNAGIIILHPFLQNFFNSAGLTDADNFKNEISKQKAVHLLQYLATGQQQLPEYIMPLNKILCGIANEEHIDRFIKLEDTELKEADELLAAVLSHWAALKNTSATALQETFLQRKGKLSFNETDSYWKLQVEKKAVDILLDKIPWGFAYIKLPWMLFPLSVEW